MKTRNYLPPEASSDWHQIIAKALYLRLVGDGPIVLTRAELERACDAEFEYGLLGDGDLLFRKAKADE